MVEEAACPAGTLRQPSLPAPCEAGSRVGIIAPSGPVKPALLSKGLRIMREWGLVPVVYRGGGLSDGCSSSLDDSNSLVEDAEDVPFLEAQRGDTSDRRAAAPGALLATAEASGFLSASDSVRAAELQAALADRSTRAVLCVRGGYGAARLLPLVDWAAAAAGAQHKRFFGFSDATVLHSAMHAAAAASDTQAAAAAAAAGDDCCEHDANKKEHSGLLTFHAPMLATGKTFVQLPSSDLERFRAALFAATLDDSMFCPLAGQLLYGATPREGTQEGGTGRAVGVLIGGNLTTLASLCGGGWFANFGVGDQGHGISCPYILALEDENETAIRIDRHCRQLRMTGLLNDGVVDNTDRAASSVAVDEARPGETKEAAEPSRSPARRRMAGLVLGRFDRDDVLLPSGALGPRGGETRGAAILCCGKRANANATTVPCPMQTAATVRLPWLTALYCCPAVPSMRGRSGLEIRRSV